MHAITPLLAGIRGAENGYAKIFARGTATRATWYSTFEGDSSDSSGDDIALDANGGAEVYVNELVDVTVVDADGAEVRSFTAGLASGNVEVRSQSFTGADYDDATSGQGSNYPTNLQDVLDLWKTKTGSYDWDVLLGSTTYTLISILGALPGLIYNVKSPSYGATGDGTADDSVAIQAAIDAAYAAGGGIVFLPAGHYYCPAKITLKGSVQLVGVSPDATSIQSNVADYALQINALADTRGRSLVSGLRLIRSSAQTNTDVLIKTGARVVISRCYIGGANTNGVVIGTESSATIELDVVDCELVTAGTASSVVSYTDTCKRSQFTRCRLVASNAGWAGSQLLYGRTVRCVDCEFDASAVTSGTGSYYASNSTTLDASFSGCRFLASGGMTATAFELGAYTGSSVFEEDGSFFDTDVVAYSYTSFDAVTDQSGARIRLATRDTRIKVVSNADATAGGDNVIQQYGQIILQQTAAGGASYSLANYRPPHGARTRITLWNDAGVAQQLTVDDPLTGTVAAWTSLADTNAGTCELIFYAIDATHYAWGSIYANTDTPFST